MEPGFGAKIRGRKNSGDSDTGRARRLKQSETGSWSRRLERLAQKALGLARERLRAKGSSLAGFRAQRGEARGQTHRERTYRQKNDGDRTP